MVDVVCSRAMSNDPRIRTITIGVNNVEDSIEQLTILRNDIEARHTYYVDLEFNSKTSLVEKIIIRYDLKDETAESPMG